ncbi:MAG: spermine/spermidine synthase domain-containing protein [Candidatus Xenobia bacterium]
MARSLQFAFFIGLFATCLGVAGSASRPELQVGTPLLAVLLLMMWWRIRAHEERWWPPLKESLERHTELIDSLVRARPARWIFLSSALALYAELMLIRWHADEFQLFVYYKNITLLACFLGLGMGFMRGRVTPLATPLVLPGMALQFLALRLMRFGKLDNLLRNPIPEHLGFGMNGQVQTISQVAVVYGLMAMVFIWTALLFIPLGHLAARTMQAESRLPAYGGNLLGSLAGVAIFEVLSFIWSPPTVWLAVLLFLMAPFLRPPGLSWGAVVGSVLVMAVLSMPYRPNVITTHSPYQVISMVVDSVQPLTLEVNHSYYQRMQNLSLRARSLDPALNRTARYYDRPYEIKPHAGRVLVLGSGTGNDVAAATRSDCAAIDAVEIDPVVLNYGLLLHPEHPYQDGRVHAFLDDARNYVRHCHQRYDLIVYGLLDSHTLLAGPGSVRLDSYVYTVEGLREARRLLTPDGVLTLSFAIMSEAQAKKILLMLQQAFDGQLPRLYQVYHDKSEMFVAGPVTPTETSMGSENLAPALARSPIRADVSTDDWPFLYMPVREYPWSYLGMLLLLLLTSAAFLLPGRANLGAPFSIPCFLLGAGFMLIETKDITELALQYGSTWMVVSVVIASILVLAFLANLVVMRWPRLPLPLCYALLALSVLAGTLTPYLESWGLGANLEKFVITLLLTIPLFFSGLAFSSEVNRLDEISSALSSNLMGALLGGLLEYNSMYFGYRMLYFLAFAMYLGASLTSRLRAGSVDRSL